MDKMREEFEAWISQFSGQSAIQRRAAWNVWKASRAALCVELPSGLTEKQFTKIAEQIENLGGEWK